MATRMLIGAALGAVFGGASGHPWGAALGALSVTGVFAIESARPSIEDRDDR